MRFLVGYLSALVLAPIGAIAATFGTAYAFGRLSLWNHPDAHWFGIREPAGAWVHAWHVQIALVRLAGAVGLPWLLLFVSLGVSLPWHFALLVMSVLIGWDLLKLRVAAAAQEYGSAELASHVREAVAVQVAATAAGGAILAVLLAST